MSNSDSGIDPPRVLVIACGALVNELGAILSSNGLDHVDLECLPAKLHNTPKQITDAVRQRIHRARTSSPDRKIVVGYADCGTGGHLDALCEQEGVTRLPGAHCYEFFAGADRFAAEHEAELGTFYLTDYLCRHFERLVWEGFGIAEHPELADMYFANYTRVLYLTQVVDPELDALAAQHAAKLGVRLEILRTGYGDLEPQMVQLTGGKRQ